MMRDIAKQLEEFQRRMPRGAPTCENIREGFWRSRTEPDLPMPVPDAWDGPDRRRFAIALQWLQNQLRPRNFRGWSTCRVCQCHNGSAAGQAVRHTRACRPPRTG